MGFNLEDDSDSVIVAMEIGYQALGDLVLLYRERSEQLLKELAIFEGKSTKEVKRQINESLLRDENEEKELLLKLKASQEIIRRINKSN